MSDNVALGPIFFISQFVMIILTAGVLWLNVVADEMLIVAFLVFGIGGLVVIIAVASVTGNLKLRPTSAKEWAAAAIGIILIVGLNVFLYWAFQIPMDVGPSTAYDWVSRVLVNVLFAIYEENLMLGMFSAGKAAGIPDLYVVVIAVLMFIPLHAWVRAIDILFAAFLAIGRFVFTALYAVTDHSDPTYIDHIIWNVINS